MVTVHTMSSRNAGEQLATEVECLGGGMFGDRELRAWLMQLYMLGKLNREFFRC